jgi:hypothetical protein
MLLSRLPQTRKSVTPCIGPRASPQRCRPYLSTASGVPVVSPGHGGTRSTSMPQSAGAPATNTRWRAWPWRRSAGAATPLADAGARQTSWTPGGRSAARFAAAPRVSHEPFQLGCVRDLVPQREPGAPTFPRVSQPQGSPACSIRDDRASSAGSRRSFYRRTIV